MIGTSALEVFDRCSYHIRLMLHRLMKQCDFYIEIEDLMCECQERWVACFEDKYENDKQFLRYMFVVMKNKIRDNKKNTIRYQRKHISDPNRLDGLNGGEREGDSAHVRIWNEMAVDTKEDLPITNAYLREVISMIESELERPFHKQIFKLMVEGLPHKKIAEELGCSTGHVVKIKTEYIWPKVQEVMNIPDKVYEVLIDSGRIYCR